MNAAENHITCTVCGVTAYPSQEMNARMQLVPTCPDCGREHAAFVPPAQVSNVTPIRSSQIPTAKEPEDVIAMIKSRIAFLDTELVQAKKYSTERKQLARMLSAAEKIK